MNIVSLGDGVTPVDDGDCLLIGHRYECIIDFNGTLVKTNVSVK